PALSPLIRFPCSRMATVLDGSVHLISCLASAGSTEASNFRAGSFTVITSGEGWLISTEAGNTVGAFLIVISKEAEMDGALVLVAIKVTVPACNALSLFPASNTAASPEDKD